MTWIENAVQAMMSFLSAIPIPVMVAGVLVLIGFCLTVSAIIPTDDEPSDELNDVLVENASGAFGMLLALWGIALGLSVYGLQYLETALAR